MCKVEVCALQMASKPTIAAIATARFLILKPEQVRVQPEMISATEAGLLVDHVLIVASYIHACLPCFNV